MAIDESIFSLLAPMEQQILDLNKYPNSPGWKKDGTSKDAARRIKKCSVTLREQVLEVLKHEELTSDEVATALGKSILSIRPRVTELFSRGLIEETGARRLNDSGAFAAVWRAKCAR